MEFEASGLESENKREIKNENISERITFKH